ncbi:MAG: hypothetical protein WA909_06750 [Castellaniella sp.]|uniref:hypothetical protein n=1 Tax=Castellaniella sp. TaxID=1955812 RepID=UPI003C78CAB3
MIIRGSMHLLVMATAVMFSMPAVAQDSGFFAGLDASAGMAHGSSGTKNGGGFGGGGVVKRVRFGTTAGIGAHAGYRFDRHLSGFLSYQHVRGDVSWDAHFSQLGQTTNFSGTAISNAVLLNMAYDWLPSDTTTIRGTVGIGATFNKLSGITEKFEGAFVAEVENHTRTSPIVQIGASIQHHLTPKTTLGLNAAVSYTGGFKTGPTRTGNLGKTDINPYEIDDVWRAGLGVSVQTRF